MSPDYRHGPTVLFLVVRAVCYVHKLRQGSHQYTFNIFCWKFFLQCMLHVSKHLAISEGNCDAFTDQRWRCVQYDWTVDVAYSWHSKKENSGAMFVVLFLKGWAQFVETLDWNIGFAPSKDVSYLVFVINLFQCPCSEYVSPLWLEVTFSPCDYNSKTLIKVKDGDCNLNFSPISPDPAPKYRNIYTAYSFVIVDISHEILNTQPSERLWSL